FFPRPADVPTEAAFTVAPSGKGSAAAWIITNVLEGGTPGYNGAEERRVGYEYGSWNYDMNPGWLGDGIFNGGGWMQGVDLVYKEKTTASGVIEAFSKSMAIQDGVRRL